MFRKLLVGGLVCFGVLGLWCAQALAEETDVDSVLQKVEKLRAEINLVNFVNGLNLTEEQLNGLIAVSKEMQTRQTELKRQYESLVRDAEKAFTNLKSNLLAKGPNLPKDVEGFAVNVNERLKEIRVKQDEEFEGHAKKVCAKLSEGQRHVISTFKPCLTPPKGQKNPVLVGQSSSNDMAMKILRGIREMPQKLFDRRREDIVQKQFEKIKMNHRTELTEEEKAAERDRVFKLLDRIRTMDDEQFELDKDKLATELKVKDRGEELHEELRSLVQERDPEVGEKMVAKYFLNPLMLPILEDRLKNLASYTQASQVNLDATTPTDRPT